MRGKYGLLMSGDDNTSEGMLAFSKLMARARTVHAKGAGHSTELDGLAEQLGRLQQKFAEVPRHGDSQQVSSLRQRLASEKAACASLAKAIERDEPSEAFGVVRDARQQELDRRAAHVEQLVKLVRSIEAAEDAAAEAVEG